MARDSAKVFCYSIFRRIIRSLCHFREIIGTSMDIGIGLFEHIRHGVDDMTRFLCCRCRVEIDEIGMRCEDRKISTKHTLSVSRVSRESRDSIRRVCRSWKYFFRWTGDMPELPRRLLATHLDLRVIRVFFWIHRIVPVRRERFIFVGGNLGSLHILLHLHARGVFVRHLYSP